MVDRVVLKEFGVEFGGDRLVVVAGPCVLESLEVALQVAREIKSICDDLGLPYVFKSSYDKANRTSLRGFRGPGLEVGLEWLSRVREEVGVPVLTDVHSTEEALRAGEVVDVLQIPAFLCRQTDLLLAAASTGKPVNVKKGQFVSPWDMAYAVEKVKSAGGGGVILCERGTFFGYGQLVVDMRSLAIMRSLGVPVMFDATHSVQRPSAGDGRSLGDRRFVPLLARAAVAVGIDALFMEVHPDPTSAKSDGPNMVKLAHLGALLEEIARLHELVSGGLRDVLEWAEIFDF